VKVKKVMPYIKGIIAGLGAVGVVVQAALTDDTISDNEKVKIGIAVLTALGVYFTPAKGYVNTGDKTKIVDPDNSGENAQPAIDIPPYVYPDEEYPLRGQRIVSDRPLPTQEYPPGPPPAPWPPGHDPVG
jgi:hypothetical protein